MVSGTVSLKVAKEVCVAIDAQASSEIAVTVSCSQARQKVDAETSDTVIVTVEDLVP